MNEKIKFWFIVMIVLFVSSCKGNNAGSSISSLQAYEPINAAACKDSVGINGRWQLVALRSDGRTTAPLTKELLIIKDCSLLEYYSADHVVKRESFKLSRVLNYCADYQLNYISKNDSISCINIRRDTLIFGDCSTFETPRFFYKRL